MLSSKSHLDGGEFDHIVAYSMACTIENDDEHELKHRVIRFGSLDEVIKVDGLMLARECHKGLARLVEHNGSVELRSSYNPMSTDGALDHSSMLARSSELQRAKIECLCFIRRSLWAIEGWS